MKILSRLAALALALVAATFCAPDVRAAARKASAPQTVATDARVDKTDQQVEGPLYATIGGRRRKLADRAIMAWLFDGGRKIVYSTPDGAGGFENEGNGLYVYDVRTERRRKVMSEYFMVTDVSEARTRSGRTALLVTMADGGLGASYFAVVDPQRGEVFFRRWARLMGRSGDQITLGFWREADWGDSATDGAPRRRPYRTERLNLNAVLRRRVIYNRPTNI